MNWRKHRYTYSQVRQARKRARWTATGRVSYGGTGHEILKRRRPQHPAFRRRRRKHPAFFSVAYVRDRRIFLNQLAEARYSYPLRTRAERMRWRKALRHHPDYSAITPIRQADLYKPMGPAGERKHQ